MLVLVLVFVGGLTALRRDAFGVGRKWYRNMERNWEGRDFALARAPREVLGVRREVFR